MVEALDIGGGEAPKPAPQVNGRPPKAAPADPSAIALAGFSAGIAGQAQMLAAIGVPALEIADMLFDHCAAIVSGVEPRQGRELIVKSVIENFPKMVDQQHRKRHVGLIV